MNYIRVDAPKRLVTDNEGVKCWGLTVIYAELCVFAAIAAVPFWPCLLQMAELHVYLVPRDKWSAPRRLAERTSKQDTISLGFVRRVSHIGPFGDVRCD
ncbi:hypothetical protein FJT64_009419 [Amphibalanus amphitrite]|uniref:Uncharacterized protein n=1 Tax=Amphibalanus amphitrite TaxID=1232801 RepID=A0A6A4VPF4_AMPAM|nr:hypothetical protein FJT64_009419 [Amphibalanus amphitrite]